MATFVAGVPAKPKRKRPEVLKDARGRVIKLGDKLVYSVISGVKTVTAAEVIQVGPKLKVRVLSHTEYGTKQGKEVPLGLSPYQHNGVIMTVIVIESDGKPVDLSERLPGIERWDAD